jgi:regulator of replication initiation timing
MTITTEEAGQMAEICDQLGGFAQCAAALRSLAAERDRLRAENEKLRAALQTARRDALEEAAKIAEEHEKKAQAKLDELTVKFFSEDPSVGKASSPTAMIVNSRKIAAAIRALSDAPSGMVLVPLEPTSAMIQACLQAALDFMAETKTTEVHPGQTYPSASENARRCWRAMVQAAGKGEGDE